MVTLALPLATFDRSVFLSPYPYYNLKNVFWPVFRKLFCRTKKERSALQTVHKKLRTNYLFLLHFFLQYATLMVFTPQRKGSDPHSHHKRKFAHEKADTDRLREAVFGKGLQADHTGGNQRKGR